MGSWYLENGPDSDVVISSRVRLARNFSQYPFPFRMNEEQSQAVLQIVTSAIQKSGKYAEEIDLIDTSNLGAIERQALVEKHIISPDLAESPVHSGVLLSKDEKISIMINEEDHLRIQCLASAMQINDTWELCDKIDTLIGESYPYAFSDKYGYLTCCPTNIGTGIRASVMLHLPALVLAGHIKTVLNACNKLGVAVRGLYGENSEASGNMFQVSNQTVLGQTEEEIVANIASITSQIVDQERILRKELVKQNPYVFEDKVCRSMGIMANARILSSEEALRLLSDVRLGVYMDVIKNVDIKTLNELSLIIQPANLQLIVGRELSDNERDIKRAEIIRQKLYSQNFKGE